MILPKVLALGAQLLIPVVDSVPTLNVEQVCTGIAQQGGVTFHDSAIAQEKKDCLDSEQAIRDELAKQWSSFNGSDKVHCTNESRMGGEFELHRIADLPGNGPRCAEPCAPPSRRMRWAPRWARRRSRSVDRDPASGIRHQVLTNQSSDY